ncbi:MAG: glycosyl hydrolase family 28 protein [Candidatus Pedobacter colombiensis]|uniref:Glycosyl hydrolase family 28 protein n=1 Tax=Candidatus Pedobacter colombiensis TaxID=3121371 RepID=A0AAJ6B7L1_9SPHI|nr:glycosyl hydrolase family 28 protein [Pedobacter sp.]WEK19969.1 MAG: glycosyl hydrolase family 28 protein [Pedobacter sp.]
MNIYKTIFLQLSILFFCSPLFSKTVIITKFGAKGDGVTINTKAIQKAIDACTQEGGTVIIPAGSFLSGTLYLKSNVTLFLEKGATIFGSTKPEDYPANSPTSVVCGDTHSGNGKSKANRALIYAESQQNIAIAGEGTINGNGGDPVYQKGDNGSDRPKLLFFISCNNVAVKDVFLTNSAFWMQDYLGCDGVIIHGIRVLNHSNWNQDGIDIDSKNVVISDCIIDSDDDGICLKSYIDDKVVENVTITNCVISTNCNAIKFGTPGVGGFKNITISNCSVNASKFSNFRNWTKRYKNITADPSMVSGISLECADGGAVENIMINNITMKGTQTPIFVKISNRQSLNKDQAKKGSMRNVMISNIIAEVHSGRTSSITAYPGTYVENVKLHHMIFDVVSTATREGADQPVKENEGGYPSTHMLGEVSPANGFYVRHVKGITIEDVQINLFGNDTRYPIVFDDTEYGTVKGVSVKNKEGKIRWINADDAQIIKSNEIYFENNRR